ncbi:ABC transporter ATP-binding protein/permease [uncultured Ruminococcus sp.]|uniref:ABC transporter ATP-binding protein/permease n=1 Tax=uncultured Ruminococcus sp. TaxID=165186 RepID=UPI00260E63AD|nr:ABC transporter ATP-binding protein/permease [uncultured Ruminococcus sp.]
MLQIKNIVKQYKTGDLVQTALDHVSLNFRDNEFVAILGPSGSGKTTMLNIIVGLDRYDSGDLIIGGISTQKYKDRDWDSYRNHTIGFVFQSYNLIPHQTVLANVELALTISGISRSERRARAKEALEQVGLGDQLHKKPNQMSGGQMQRVAIARALVNNPDILLADEPTGALDTETSVQVMDLLKKVAKDRLVIMVTHNPELAEAYATRIVKLRDGKILDDSDPFAIPETKEAPVHKNMGKSSMSFLTALSLSFNNLRTKKARTILTSFAGSIGIIGIAMVLSLSNGISQYIETVQKDTLSTYPLTIEKESMDMTSMMTDMMSQNVSEESGHEKDKVYSNNIAGSMLSTMSQESKANDLGTFKSYLEGDESDIDSYISDIQYSYDLDLQLYSTDTSDGVVQVNPSTLNSTTSGSVAGSEMPTSASEMTAYMSFGNVFSEMLDNRELVESQYDILAGRMPDADDYNELILVVDEHNEISDVALYTLGLMDQDEFRDMMQKVMQGETVEETENVSFTYDDLLNTSFKLVLNTDYYQYNETSGVWEDKRDDDTYMKQLVEDAPELKIVGIIRPDEEATATSINGSIAYNSALTDYVVNHINDSEIAKAQVADPDTNVLTGTPFNIDEYVNSLTMEDLQADVAQMSQEEQAQFQQMAAVMSEEELLESYRKSIRENSTDTYDGVLAQLGVVDLEQPSAISIYPKDFDAKDSIVSIIDDYNDARIDDGHEEMTITYTDYVGLMMTSVTTIVNMISYVLIAFVSISLVVSSIMIGIITYISVLERTKEIGILRGIGASKRNISSIFNAETLIIGTCAGLIGIGVTLVLLVPANAIIGALTDISNLAQLPWKGAVILVLISMFLTVIAGLIPSKKAAKKDPVTALRTE